MRRNDSLPPMEQMVRSFRRFATKIEVQPNGCWNWTSALDRRGYGRFGVRSGLVVFAHRLAYQASEGDIAPGLVLDHLCRNPRCCNPDHLEPVTQRVNVRRGNGNAAKQACPRGHPYDRIVRTPNGVGRRCTVCDREAQRRRRWQG